MKLMIKTLIGFFSFGPGVLLSADFELSKTQHTVLEQNCAGDCIYSAGDQNGGGGAITITQKLRDYDGLILGINYSGGWADYELGYYSYLSAGPVVKITNGKFTYSISGAVYHEGNEFRSQNSYDSGIVDPEYLYSTHVTRSSGFFGVGAKLGVSYEIDDVFGVVAYVSRIGSSTTWDVTRRDQYTDPVTGLYHINNHFTYSTISDRTVYYFGFIFRV